MNLKQSQKLLKKLLLVFCFSIAFTADAQNKKNEVLKIKTSAECEQCKKKIESNLIYTKGVKFCKLDVPSKIVTVTYNSEKTNPDNIRKSLTLLGYDADGLKADSLEYSKLPDCCKIGGGEHK